MLFKRCFPGQDNGEADRRRDFPSLNGMPGGDFGQLTGHMQVSAKAQTEGMKK